MPCGPRLGKVVQVVHPLHSTDRHIFLKFQPDVAHSPFVVLYGVGKDNPLYEAIVGQIWRVTVNIDTRQPCMDKVHGPPGVFTCATSIPYCREVMWLR